MESKHQQEFGNGVTTVRGVEGREIKGREIEFHNTLLGKVVFGEIKEKRLNSMSGLAQKKDSSGHGPQGRCEFSKNKNFGTRNKYKSVKSQELISKFGEIIRLLTEIGKKAQANFN